MNSFFEFVQNYTGINPLIQKKILFSIAVLLLFIGLRILILKIVWRKTEDVKVRYLWKEIINYSLTLLALLMLTRIWVKSFGQLGTFLGLVSAGIAIALKDPLVNIVAWLFILIRKPFAVGDRIQIGAHTGDVVDIRIFQFSIMEVGHWVEADQPTGRIVHIPNGKVFTESIANYSQEFEYIWDEIKVLLTFESNWKKAKEVLQKIAEKLSAYKEIEDRKTSLQARSQLALSLPSFKPSIYTSVEESGVLLTIRYPCSIHQRRHTSAAIWEEILGRFAADPELNFAYPTQKVYIQSQE